ncbi:ABC transporter permease [Treponema primitia]|uniref:ABC transporter permease n=1 Tax=Treponema primitia TaxID=88058 RepID=UPI00025555DD|nr:ABC transporter permease [Treponema primitia]
MSKNSSKLLNSIKQSDLLVLLAVLAVLCIVVSFLTPVFLSQRNIMNTLRQVSLTAICGFGLTMVILVGEIDLSVGSQQAIAGISSIYILNATHSIPLAILAALVCGVIVGAVNGILVTKAKLNSLIATLGTMAIWRGLAMVITGAVSIQSGVEAFQGLATGFVGFIPNAVIIAALLYLIIYYVLNHTTFGRKIYAIGGNKEASRLAGLSVDRIKLLVYIFSGVLTMLSGVLLASRMASAQPTAGTGFEMVVIASVILGGVSLNGGIGTIAGALIGMIILGVLQNGLTLLDVSSFWQDITRGLVIILAVFVDTVRKDSIAKRLVKEQKMLQQ